jgi:hypothetical protein
VFTVKEKFLAIREPQLSHDFDGCDVLDGPAGFHVRDA